MQAQRNAASGDGCNFSVVLTADEREALYRQVKLEILTAADRITHGMDNDRDTVDAQKAAKECLFAAKVLDAIGWQWDDPRERFTLQIDPDDLREYLDD